MVRSVCLSVFLSHYCRTLIYRMLEVDSGVTMAGVTRGGNWWYHPIFFVKKNWRPFLVIASGSDCLFSCRLHTIPIFPRRLYSVLSIYKKITRLSLPGGCQLGWSPPPPPPPPSDATVSWTHLTNQRGPTTTERGRSDLDLEKFTPSTSPKRRQILRLLWNMTSKSLAPIICHNDRYRLITGNDRTRLFTYSAHPVNG